MARGIVGEQFDNRAAIAQVDEPIMIMHAPDDELVPFSQARALQALGKRVRFIKLEGMGHAVDFTFLGQTIWENIRQMPR